MRLGSLCRCRRLADPSTAQGDRRFSFRSSNSSGGVRVRVCEGRGKGERKEVSDVLAKGSGVGASERRGELFFTLAALALTLMMMMMKSLFLRATFWLFASFELKLERRTIAKTMTDPRALQVHM